MEQTVTKSLKKLIATARINFKNIDETAWNYKPIPEKWSKKEILGHLIDSAIHNLQRFNAILALVENGIYKIEPYHQNDLVKTNRYQDASSAELIQLWTALNTQICHITQNLDERSLHTQILIVEDKCTFQWLISDYNAHAQHHLDQILRIEI